MELFKLLFFTCVLATGAFGQETSNLAALRRGVIDVETGLTQK
jgi:hypothetical protein